MCLLDKLSMKVNDGAADLKWNDECNTSVYSPNFFNRLIWFSVNAEKLDCTYVHCLSWNMIKSTSYNLTACFLSSSTWN